MTTPRPKLQAKHITDRIEGIRPGTIGSLQQLLATIYFLNLIKLVTTLNMKLNYSVYFIFHSHFHTKIDGFHFEQSVNFFSLMQKFCLLFVDEY